MQAFHAQYLAVRDVVSASAMLSAIPIVPEVRLYEYFVLVCSRFIMIFQDESYDVRVLHCSVSCCSVSCGASRGRWLQTLDEITVNLPKGVNGGLHVIDRLRGLPKLECFLGPSRTTNAETTT